MRLIIVSRWDVVFLWRIQRQALWVTFWRADSHSVPDSQWAGSAGCLNCEALPSDGWPTLRHILKTYFKTDAETML